jgi:hypothetical protein
MAERLLRSGHQVVACDIHADLVGKYVAKGAVGSLSWPEAAGKLQTCFLPSLPVFPSQNHQRHPISGFAEVGHAATSR